MRTSFALIVITAFYTGVLTQPSQSTPWTAVQLSRLQDIRFPSTVSQCEPVPIYHNTTESYALHIYTMESGVSYTLLRLTVPRGIGYLEWICNIPAGYTFVVLNSYAHVLSVQPGSSSACLGDVTTTYAYADYDTTDFRSYTAHANPSAPDISAFRGVPTSFPTGAFTTITLNPDLGSPTRSGPSSLPSVSATSLAPAISRKSTTPAIVGGVIGAVIALSLFIVGIALVLKRRKSQPHAMYHPMATSEAIDIGLMANSQEPLVRSADSPSDSHTSFLPPSKYSDPDALSDSKHSPGSSKSTPPEPILSAPLRSPRSQTQPQAPDISSQPSTPTPLTDVTTALNLIARMDSTQQHTLISVLNTLAPASDPPPYAPTPPSTTSNI